jgi:hypothetical protein
VRAGPTRCSARSRRMTSGAPSAHFEAGALVGRRELRVDGVRRAANPLASNFRRMLSLIYRFNNRRK